MGTTPAQAAQAVDVARWIRPRISWTQREGLRRLAYALRPWLTAGMTREDIAAELASWWLTWRPRSAAAYITARQQAPRTAGPATPSADGLPEAGCGSARPTPDFLETAQRIRQAWTPPRTCCSKSCDDEPDTVVRDRILASFAQADARGLARGPLECDSLEEWSDLTDQRTRATWWRAGTDT
jgi:hypothetical protein